VANLTLALDDELLRASRKVAIDRNTSVNQLVREYLEGLVRENDGRAQALEEIRKMHREKLGELGPVTWTRDDLHER
jgi:hypothetical protein